MSKQTRSSWCGGSDHVWNPNRRDFLFVGAVGTLGLTLPNVVKASGIQANMDHGTKIPAKAKSVIQIHLPGGMAHQESWDPQVDAPIEYRGPLGSVATKIPGVRFSQHMDHMAKIADKITVIRSMTHGEAAHERGTHNMFCGYRPSPALMYPSFGSVVSHEFGPRANLPAYVCVPNQPNVYAGTGYLSSAYGPFSLGSDPASGNFEVRDLNMPKGIDQGRFDRRRTMREAVDAHFSQLEKSDALDGMDAFYQRAYSLISSEKARDAFAINKEDNKLRDRYGRNQSGQRMLLARRLVESGVRFVTLTCGSWDHHDNIKNAMDGRMPELDQALSALITDLDERGMLDETLVVVGSEFGRTPMINANAGRDHWPKVYSMMMAGGGVARGVVHGSSNAIGAEPEDNPVSVEDYATTMYNLIGIDAAKELMAPGARPIEIVKDGRLINEILA